MIEQATGYPTARLNRAFALIRSMTRQIVKCIYYFTQFHVTLHGIETHY